MLYSSSSLSLACLEILVHIKQPHLPNDYAFARFDLPEALVLTHDAADLDNEDICAEIGTRWIETGDHLALRVPSVIVPIESNILFNPQHPDFRHLSVSEPSDFAFDLRLLKLSPFSL
jgi:RES domain-containing protein